MLTCYSTRADSDAHKAHQAGTDLSAACHCQMKINIILLCWQLLVLAMLMLQLDNMFKPPTSGKEGHSVFMRFNQDLSQAQ